MSRSIVHVRRKKKESDPLRSAWHILEEWMEVNRERILTITGIAVGLVAVVGLAYYFFDYRQEKQLSAYAAAFDKYTATVGAETNALPGMPSTNKVTFPDEQTKYTESAAAFEQLASDYSAYHDIGRYYAALSYLHTDADKGVKLLDELASSNADLRYEARLALAEHYDQVGAFDKAEPYYQQLSDDPGKLPRFYVLNELAQVKERLNKPAEAAPLYKMVIDGGRDTPFSADAEKGLQRVDPAAAAALPPKAGGPGANPSNTIQQPGQAPISIQ